MSSWELAEQILAKAITEAGRRHKYFENTEAPGVDKSKVCDKKNCFVQPRTATPSPHRKSEKLLNLCLAKTYNAKSLRENLLS